jgi:hypothetical protein
VKGDRLPPVNRNGTYGRFWMVPEHKMFMLSEQHDAAVVALRLR